jgi:N-acetylmuramoyl-L-alanine amidase
MVSPLVSLLLLNLLARQDATAPPGTSIVVAGQRFEVGRTVVLWNDPERGFDGYANRCIEERARATNPCCAAYEPHFRARPPEQRTLAELQRIVRLVVLHHDGCANSRSCFYLMHDGCKKVSAHFMIDNDGTIYQTLDLAEVAYHARLVNDFSIGIELCNIARVGQEKLPEEYRERAKTEVRIKGDRIEAYDFRAEQYQSVAALTRTLLQVFPGIPAQVPLDAANQPYLDFLEDPRDWIGIVGHVHVDNLAGKWDPGAFRWLEFLDALTGIHLPLAVDGFERFPIHDPVLSDRVAQTAFANAERMASAQFPLQAGGLVHAGVNLRGMPGAPVVSPLPGVLQAARLASREGSSTSFVLIRHQVQAGDRRLVFHSLLFHLDPVPLARSPPPVWLQRLVRSGDRKSREKLQRGEIVHLDLPVAAGELVGFLGRVRRGPEQGSELRFEIFSAEPPSDDDGFWRRVRAAESGPFLRSAAVDGLLDLRGALPTAAALKRFFRLERRPGSRVRSLRRLVIEHVHEWSSRSTESAYLTAPELSALSPAERRLVYRVAADPYRFLTPELTRHAGLPADQVVHSYNPIAFLHWLSARKGAGALRPPPAVAPGSAPELAKAAPSASERRGPWLSYLESPPVKEPPSFHLRLVEVPVRLKRRDEMPIVEAVRSDRAPVRDLSRGPGSDAPSGEAPGRDFRRR